MKGVSKNSQSLLVALPVDQPESRFQHTFNLTDIGDQVTPRQANQVGEEEKVEHDLITKWESRVQVNLSKAGNKQ